MDLGRISVTTAPNPSRQERRNWKRIKQISCCSCATLIRRRAATYSFGRINFFRTLVESSSHSFTCPLYIRTEATTTLGLKMAFYGRLLAKTVQATISITAGAGGCSINPCLKFHAVVPNDSPAFLILNYRAFRKRFPRNQSPTTSPSQSIEVCDFFQSTLQDLYELFQDGRASPTDTSEFGQTLLHVI